MVKANPEAVARALRALPEDCGGALLYGPDDGLVRELAERIARQIVADLGDPFRVSRLSSARLKAEPAALADALGALSMTGGRRLVILDLGSDGGSGPGELVKSALACPREAFLLVIAGSLPPRSALRLWFEKDPHLLAIACYGDAPGALAALIDETLAAAGLETEPAAREYLCAHLGQDRALTRQELEKLVLYKWDAPDRRVRLGDAEAVVGDAAAMTVSDLVVAVTGGDVATADVLLEKALAMGESPVALLRRLARRFQEFDLVHAYMAEGCTAAQAVERLVPRLFFKEREPFLRSLDRWPAARVAAALDRLFEAEADCKSTGLPAETICARTCLALAASAGAGRSAHQRR